MKHSARFRADQAERLRVRQATAALADPDLRPARRARIDQKLTSRAVAEAAGMSVSNLLLLEKGKIGGTPASRAAVARALGRDPGELFTPPG